MGNRADQIEQHEISDLFTSNNVSNLRLTCGIRECIIGHSTDIKTDQFADIFQQCAPYIAKHR